MSPVLYCPPCARSQPKIQCSRCADLRDIAARLATPHTALVIAKPASIVQRGGSAGATTYRDTPERGGLELDHARPRAEAPWNVGYGLVLSAGGFGGAWYWSHGLSSFGALAGAVVGVLGVTMTAVGLLESTERTRIVVDGAKLHVRSDVLETSMALSEIEQIVVRPTVSFASPGESTTGARVVHCVAIVRKGKAIEILNGTHDEARYVEQQLEQHLELVDDPTKNVVTAVMR